MSSSLVSLIDAADASASLYVGIASDTHKSTVATLQSASPSSAVNTAKFDHILNDHSQNSSSLFHQTDMRIESGWLQCIEW